MTGKHLINCSRWSKEQVMSFAQYGAECKPDIHRIIVDHTTYKDLVYKHNLIPEIPQPDDHIFHRVDWSYTKQEFLSSEYCVLKTNRYWCGYPAPEDFEELVYDLNSYCPRCGGERIQVHPFRVEKVSKHKLWGFFACEFHVLFADEELYKEVFAPLGIGYYPVVYASGKAREGVVQLDIPIIDEDIDPFYVETTIECRQCHRVKSKWKFLLPFFPQHKNPLPHIYLTKERFGAENPDSGNRDIIISTPLAAKLIEMKALKWEFLTPCVKNYEEFLKTTDYYYK